MTHLASMVDVVNKSLGEAAGAELGPDLITHAGHASIKELKDLHDAYQEYRTDWTLPARPAPGWMSPYLAGYPSGAPDIALREDFRDTEDIDQSVRELHLQLLYAHRVAMPNPFIAISHLIRTTPDENPNSKYLDNTRAQVAGYLNFPISGFTEPMSAAAKWTTHDMARLQRRTVLMKSRNTKFTLTG
jgi:hypothetical protein